MIQTTASFLEEISVLQWGFAILSIVAALLIWTCLQGGSGK